MRALLPKCGVFWCDWWANCAGGSGWAEVSVGGCPAPSSPTRDVVDPEEKKEERSRVTGTGDVPLPMGDRLPRGVQGN